MSAREIAVAPLVPPNFFPDRDTWDTWAGSFVACLTLWVTLLERVHIIRSCNLLRVPARQRELWLLCIFISHSLQTALLIKGNTDVLWGSSLCVHVQRHIIATEGVGAGMIAKEGSVTSSLFTSAACTRQDLLLSLKKGLPGLLPLPPLLADDPRGILPSHHTYLWTE